MNLSASRRALPLSAHSPVPDPASALTRAAIIVAGGKGRRMGGDVPKQFLPLEGRPVLMRTIDRFRQFDPTMQIVLVLPKDQQDYWLRLCGQYDLADSARIVLADGGEERFHSVRNGLLMVSSDVDLISIHDGVRPFVSLEVIRACYAEAARSGAAIPVVPVVETLRHLYNKESSITVPRSDYRLVQTPQVFRADLLRRAYEQPFRDTFTDDASVVEALGHGVTFVEGNRENIKLTTPFDLRVASVLL